MIQFQPLDGSVVLCARGLYTESPLFEMEGEVYARRGRGFLRLRQDGRTSQARVFWRNLRSETAFTFHRDIMRVGPRAVFQRAA